MAAPTTAAIRRHVVVAGRVQGVWFRDSCRAEARRLGVAGWVRNRSDGRVEAEVEGPPDGVLTLVNWCQHGPPRAQVTDIEVTEIEPIGEVGFSIR
jgi:acylphosphatase